MKSRHALGDSPAGPFPQGWNSRCSAPHSLIMPEQKIMPIPRLLLGPGFSRDLGEWQMSLEKRWQAFKWYPLVGFGGKTGRCLKENEIAHPRAGEEALPRGKGWRGFSSGRANFQVEVERLWLVWGGSGLGWEVYSATTSSALGVCDRILGRKNGCRLSVACFPGTWILDIWEGGLK